MRGEPASGAVTTVHAEALDLAEALFVWPVSLGTVVVRRTSGADGGPTMSAVQIGSGKVHDVAGRTSSGGYLTICGREFGAAYPKLQEVYFADVPLADQCLLCWGR